MSIFVGYLNDRLEFCTYYTYNTIFLLIAYMRFALHVNLMTKTFKL